MRKSDVEVEVFVGKEGRDVGEQVAGLVLSEDFTIWVNDKMVFDSEQDMVDY